MARQITKEMALKIVKKLKAKNISRKSSAHDEYGLEHDGRIVVVLGIRRGSEKDKGHDHLLNDLFLNAHHAKNLANCPLSREEYLRILQERGVV